jgi:hypothetical protein
MSRRNRTLIEFTENTKDAEGNIVREKGDRLLVDPMSFESFVKTKKVAKEVKESTPSAPASSTATGGTS